MNRVEGKEENVQKQISAISQKASAMNRLDFESSNPVITIDGPAASGKSSASRGLAKKLGWSWVSTGAFYRGLSFAAKKENIPVDDEKSLVELATSGRWKVQMSSEYTQVLYGDLDVSSEIQKEEIGNIASQISSLPKVREALLDLQRACAENVVGLVAEGRDCGTVVFPKAQLKFFLTAHGDNRAKRRAEEEGRSLNEILAEQAERDKKDTSRKVAPLGVAENGIVVDTSELNLEQVVEHLHSVAIGTTRVSAPQG